MNTAKDLGTTMYMNKKPQERLEVFWSIYRQKGLVDNIIPKIGLSSYPRIFHPND